VIPRFLANASNFGGVLLALHACQPLVYHLSRF